MNLRVKFLAIHLRWQHRDSFLFVYHEAKNEIHVAEGRHPGKVWSVLRTIRILYELPLLVYAAQQTLKVGGLMW